MGIDYRYGSQTVFKIQYHFVFVTKYRYQVLKVILIEGQRIDQANM